MFSTSSHFEELNQVLKVGLTGGLGCGKSTVLKMFQKKDVPIIDADVIARELVQQGQPALREIGLSLGKRFIDSNGQLNRVLLKKEVFSDLSLLRKLESILHPRVRHTIQQQIAEMRTAHGYVIVDVPLLVEKKYHRLFDRIVVVECTMKQQLQRVTERDNIDEKMIKLIIKRQATEKERLVIATETLDNKGSKAMLEEQVEVLHAKFTVGS